MLRRMHPQRRFSGLALALLGLALAATSCRGEPKSTRWDEKAAELEAGRTATVDKSTVAAGSTLNAFFPKEDDALTRTFTQEKTGFAEAKIVVGGQSAKVSISDIRSNPKAADKFASATDDVDGHKLVTVGKRQSAVLVAGRWQVKVSSSELDPSARAKLLQSFDLAGLAAR